MGQGRADPNLGGVSFTTFWVGCPLPNEWIGRKQSRNFSFTTKTLQPGPFTPGKRVSLAADPLKWSKPKTAVPIFPLETSPQETHFKGTERRCLPPQGEIEAQYRPVQPQGFPQRKPEGMVFLGVIPFLTACSSGTDRQKSRSEPGKTYFPGTER